MTKLALTFPGGTGSVAESDVGSGFKFSGETPADIINDLMPLVFVLAGLILFIMLIAGGLTVFMSAGNPEKIKQGQTRIVNSLIGLLIIFAAYWIVQLVEFSLGVSLLGGAPPP